MIKILELPTLKSNNSRKTVNRFMLLLIFLSICLSQKGQLEEPSEEVRQLSVSWSPNGDWILYSELKGRKFELKNIST